MSFPKILFIGSIVILGLIGVTAALKKSKNGNEKPPVVAAGMVQEIEIKKEEPVTEFVVEPVIKINVDAPKEEKQVHLEPVMAEVKEDPLPEANIIDKLFVTNSSKLPVVETLTYTSRVPWLKGRPAWIADYASYYETTRHFIARSLNRKADYFTQKVSPGDRFNVLCKDKDIGFHLLIDLSCAKMWFYCIDKGANERYLLKTYHVGLGRKEASHSSGCLTPTGKYTLGSKVAIYKPGTMGYFQDQKIEMLKVFGTRWIPFEEEVEGCSEQAKGFGLHGAPWKEDKNGFLVEDKEKIGKYESDGCVRLFSEDIEEIFSIVISRPTIVELVQNFHEANLPGVEKKL